MTIEPSPPSALAPRPQWATAVIILLIGRVGLFLFVYLARWLVEMRHPAGNVFPGNLFLDGWMQWDSIWYGSIAEHGYTNIANAHGERDTAFFPLLPLLANLGGRLIGNPNLAGLLICNTAFIVAGVLLYRMTWAWFGQQIASRSLVLLCLWPFAFVFSAMYAEALLLLAAVGMFAAIEKRWWLAAGLCAAAASATRPPGILLTPALMLAYLQHIHWNPKNLRPSVLFTLIGFAGIGAYALFLHIRFGDSLAMIHAQNAPLWGERSTFAEMIAVLRRTAHASFGTIASGNFELVNLLNILLVFPAIGVLFLAWRKLPLPCAAWATMAVLITITRWISAGRQLAVIFPLFVAASTVLNGRAFVAVVYLLTLMLALVTFLYCQSLWIG